MLFVLNYEIILHNFLLNESQYELEEIIKLAEKFLNPQNIPILTEQEILIAKYWETTQFCPFSKLISHNLTKKEAFLLMSFFDIKDVQDLEKINEFIKNI